MSVITEIFRECGIWLYPMGALAVIGGLWLLVQTGFGAVGKKRHFPPALWLLGPVLVVIVASIGVGVSLSGQLEEFRSTQDWGNQFRFLSRGVAAGMSVALIGGIISAVLAGGAALGIGVTSNLGAQRDGKAGIIGALICVVVTMMVAIAAFVGIGAGGDEVRTSARLIIAVAVLVGGFGCALTSLSGEIVGNFDEQRPPSQYVAVLAALLSIASATIVAMVRQGQEVLEAVEFARPEARSGLIEVGMEMIWQVGLIGLISMIVIAIVGVICVIGMRGRRWTKKATIDAAIGAVLLVLLLAALGFGWSQISTFASEYAEFNAADIEESGPDADRVEPDHSLL